ncbi:MAG: hypothetical protein L0H41_12100 [Microlunatus sp.]|nr:hypothetical protein [Microlunatus sp.]
MTDDAASEDLARLCRWEDAGGTWRVLRRRPEAVLLSLGRCDAGEEVDRLLSEDPAVFEHVGGRESSEEAIR